MFDHESRLVLQVSASRDFWVKLAVDTHVVFLHCVNGIAIAWGHVDAKVRGSGKSGVSSKQGKNCAGLDRWIGVAN